MIDSLARARTRRRNETIEFRLLFGATYLIFLVLALLGRIVPRRGPSRRGSVFAEAREVASTIIPMAFTA